MLPNPTSVNLLVYFVISYSYCSDLNALYKWLTYSYCTWAYTAYVKIFEGCNFQGFYGQLFICKIFILQLESRILVNSYTAMFDTCMGYWQVSTLTAAAVEVVLYLIRANTTYTFQLVSHSLAMQDYTLI